MIHIYLHVFLELCSIFSEHILAYGCLNKIRSGNSCVPL